MKKQNYYQILGVSPDSTSEEIKAAYRRLAFEYHPDRNSGDKTAGDRMKALNEAYAVLSDDQKRRHYHSLYQQYGDGARKHFRQTFSEQDIFRGSDIHQMFEEMARACGLRGFDDIFKEFYGQGYQRFEFRSQGIFGRGVLLGSALGGRQGGNPPSGIAGTLVRKLLNKLVAAHLPRQGDDIRAVIVLTTEFACQGGPYAYHHRARDKKLVVHVPTGVRDGQLIRLAGMGQEGTRGAEAGDLLLKVKIREPFLKKLKKIIARNP